MLSKSIGLGYHFENPLRHSKLRFYTHTNTHFREPIHGDTLFDIKSFTLKNSIRKAASSIKLARFHHKSDFENRFFFNREVISNKMGEPVEFMFPNRRRRSLMRVFNCGKFDTTLFTSEKLSVRAHRYILVAFSGYFRKVFAQTNPKHCVGGLCFNL